MQWDHSRSYKKRAWVKVIPVFWPIVTSLIVGGVYIGGWILDVNSYASATKANTQAIKDMQEPVARVPMVEQKVDSLKDRVDDIAMFLGVPERKRHK